jgi:hypothetical protein
MLASQAAGISEKLKESFGKVRNRRLEDGKILSASGKVMASRVRFSRASKSARGADAFTMLFVFVLYNGKTTGAGFRFVAASDLVFKLLYFA